MLSKIQQTMLIILGSLFLATGTLGIFLPLLPTTPFLLLAAACYMRSSPQLYHWLINHQQLGPFIRNYREKKGIPKQVKILTLLLLWTTIGISIYVTQHNHLTIFLLMVAIGVSIHILKLKTL